jgi:DNA polymerase-3 subunit beta
MQAKVLKENLQRAVTELARIAPARSSLPICADVLLATEDGRLTATATDLERTVKAYLGAQVEQEGSITVPARTLQKMLKRLPDEAMTIIASGTSTTFEMHKRSFTLEGQKAEDFPPMRAEFDKRGEVGGAELKDRLKRTAFCTRQDDARPTLRTVNMVAADGTLTLAAADGFRLAQFTMPYKGDAFKANVPLPLAATLIRLLPDDVIGIDIGEASIRLSFGLYDVSGQLVQGSFPVLDSLIPDSYDHAVTVKRDELKSEAETAMVLAAESANILRLLTGPDTLTVQGRSEGSGAYEGAVAACVEGKEGKTALNGRYLVEILSHMESGPVLIDWRPSRVIRLQQSADGFYLVMPMAVQW